MPTIRLALGISFQLAFSLVSVAAVAADGGVAAISVGERWAEWRPFADNSRLLLRIAIPGGEVREFSFDGRSLPLLKFEPATAWPDGTYAYELIAEPRPSAADEVGRPSKRQSGFFRLEDGNGVPNDRREGAGPRLRSVSAPAVRSAPRMDQVAGDDLIVQGSACAGPGCSNGEGFGNDTLRLKGSVVGINLEDTSSDPFPSGDWRLRANDDVSGGASYLVVEDGAGAAPLKFIAGAPTDSVFVNGSGLVGFGTNVPASRVHVVGLNGDGKAKVTVEELSSTAGPREMLELRNKGGVAFILKDTNTGVAERWSNGAFSSNYVINNQAQAGVEYTFGPSGNLTIAGTLTQNSDRNAKERLEAVDLDGVLAGVVSLPISKWSYKSSPGARHLGPMAQDFAAAFRLGDADTGISAVDADGVALAALQALYRLVTEENAELRGRLEQLEAQQRGMTCLSQGREAPALSAD